MSLNIKTDDGYISVAGGSVEPLKYTAITGAGVTVNNDPESTGYRTIENTGVLSIETGTGKDTANGTILVQTGVASATNPAVAVAVKGLNNAAYKDVDTKVDSTTKTSEKLPTTKAVYDTLKKIEDGVFQRDTDAVSTKTVPSGVKNYAVVEKIYGKTKKSPNLAALTDATNTFHGISYTIKDGVITVSGTETSGSTTFLVQDTNWQANTKLTLDAGTYVFNSSPSGNIQLDIRDASASTVYASTTTTTFTLASRTDVYVNIRVVANATITSTQFKPMLVKSGDDTTYMPANTLWSAPIESVVSQSKNLWKFTQNATITSDGYIVNKYADFELSEGTYTISIGSITNGIQFALYDSDKNALVNQIIKSTDSSKSYTFTLNKKVSYAAAYMNAGTVTAIMLEKGATATAYTPYFLNEIELSEAIKSLPDYGASCPDGNGDTVYNWIDFENGVYHHIVKKISLSGLSFVSASTNRWKSSTAIDSSLSSESGIANRLCFISNKLNPNNSVISNTGTTTDYDAALFTDKCIYIMLPSSITTAIQAQSALTDVVLYVKLAQEEVKNISDIIRPIKCETGGTITLKNEHNLDVANTIIYEKEVL